MTEKILGFFKEYRFLSNFWSCTIEYEGMFFPSTEAAYQAAKSLDPEVRAKFLGLSFRESKELGRKIECRKDWDTVRIPVMRMILRKKFKNADLRKKLLDTGDAYLEETNSWNDCFWGVCKGVGENHLGKLLMEIREEIKEEEKKPTESF